MFESVNAISNAKNLEDKYKFQIEQQDKLIENLKNEKHELEQSLFSMMKARDALRDEVKEMVEAKNRVEREKTMNNLQSRESIAKMTQQIKEL